jgi:hypothetical protein
MSEPTKQTYIIVNIIDKTTVNYTYYDPEKKKLVTHDYCDLKLLAPSCCLFVLDKQSTAAGWSITQVLPNKGPVIDYQLGPLGLSVATLADPAKAATYNYFIVYANSIDNATYFIDPQEVNIPPQECPPR